MLEARYDFSQHAIAPAWSKILGDLSARHKALAAWEALRVRAAAEWRVDDVPAFQAQVVAMKTDPSLSHPSVKALLQLMNKSDDAGLLIENIVGIQDQFGELDATLHTLLAEHERFDFPELAEVLAKLREQTGTLAELSPILADLTELPELFSHALRHAPGWRWMNLKPLWGTRAANGAYRGRSRRKPF